MTELVRQLAESAIIGVSNVDKVTYAQAYLALTPEERGALSDQFIQKILTGSVGTTREDILQATAYLEINSPQQQQAQAIDSLAYTIAGMSTGTGEQTTADPSQQKRIMDNLRQQFLNETFGIDYRVPKMTPERSKRAFARNFGLFTLVNPHTGRLLGQEMAMGDTFSLPTIMGHWQGALQTGAEIYKHVFSSDTFDGKDGWEALKGRVFTTQQMKSIPLMQARIAGLVETKDGSRTKVEEEMIEFKMEKYIDDLKGPFEFATLSSLPENEVTQVFDSYEEIFKDKYQIADPRATFKKFKRESKKLVPNYNTLTPAERIFAQEILSREMWTLGRNLDVATDNVSLTVTPGNKFFLSLLDNDQKNILKTDTTVRPVCHPTRDPFKNPTSDGKRIFTQWDRDKIEEDGVQALYVDRLIDGRRFTALEMYGVWDKIAHFYLPTFRGKSTERIGLLPSGGPAEVDRQNYEPKLMVFEGSDDLPLVNLKNEYAFVAADIDLDKVNYPFHRINLATGDLEPVDKNTLYYTLPDGTVHTLTSIPNNRINSENPNDPLTLGNDEDFLHYDLNGRKLPYLQLRTAEGYLIFDRDGNPVLMPNYDRNRSFTNIHDKFGYPVFEISHKEGTDRPDIRRAENLDERYANQDMLPQVVLGKTPGPIFDTVLSRLAVTTEIRSLNPWGVGDTMPKGIDRSLLYLFFDHKYMVSLYPHQLRIKFGLHMPTLNARKKSGDLMSRLVTGKRSKVRSLSPDNYKDAPYSVPLDLYSNIYDKNELLRLESETVHYIKNGVEITDTPRLILDKSLRSLKYDDVKQFGVVGALRQMSISPASQLRPDMVDALENRLWVNEFGLDFLKMDADFFDKIEVGPLRSVRTLSQLMNFISSNLDAYTPSELENIIEAVYLREIFSGPITKDSSNLTEHFEFIKDLLMVVPVDLAREKHLDNIIFTKGIISDKQEVHHELLSSLAQVSERLKIFFPDDTDLSTVNPQLLTTASDGSRRFLDESEVEVKFTSKEDRTRIWNEIQAEQQKIMKIKQNSLTSRKKERVVKKFLEIESTLRRPQIEKAFRDFLGDKRSPGSSAQAVASLSQATLEILNFSYAESLRSLNPKLNSIPDEDLEGVFGLYHFASLNTASTASVGERQAQFDQMNYLLKMIDSHSELVKAAEETRQSLPPAMLEAITRQLKTAEEIIETALFNREDPNVLGASAFKAYFGKVAEHLVNIGNAMSSLHGNSKQNYDMLRAIAYQVLLLPYPVESKAVKLIDNKGNVRSDIYSADAVSNSGSPYLSIGMIEDTLKVLEVDINSNGFTSHFANRVFADTVRGFGFADLSPRSPGKQGFHTSAVDAPIFEYHHKEAEQLLNSFPAYWGVLDYNQAGETDHKNPEFRSDAFPTDRIKNLQYNMAWLASLVTIAIADASGWASSARDELITDFIRATNVGVNEGKKAASELTRAELEKIISTFKTEILDQVNKNLNHVDTEKEEKK